MSHGLFGGLPAGNTVFELRSGTRLREALPVANPVDLDALGGEMRLLPPQALLRLDATSVLLVRGDGGGGVGDPLLRAPAAVFADVQAGLVSVDGARRLYGVVLTAGGEAVDAAATGRQREALRAARLGRAPTAAAGDDGLDGASVRPPVQYDRAAGVARCAACAGTLGPLAENWKGRAVEQVERLAELGPQMASTLFVLRSYSCPACGVLLDAEMTLPSDPPVHTYSPPAVLAGQLASQVPENRHPH
jgi:N-methylhydantoinase B